MSEKFGATIGDIFKTMSRHGMKIPHGITVPNNVYQQMLDYFLERGYLNFLPEREKFVDFREFKREKNMNIAWLCVTRLPIHPSAQMEYDLLSRWQCVLSALHTWGNRLIFMLRRKNGETNIYLGTAALTGKAIEQFKEAASGGMPGIELAPLVTPKEKLEFHNIFAENNCVGAITGIPSIKKNERAAQFGVLQTLDQLAFGIRDLNGYERDYTMLVIADPINDEEISKTISRFRKLGSEIHTEVLTTVTEGESYTKSKEASMGIGAILGGILSVLPGFNAFSGIGTIISGIEESAQETIGSSTSVQKQYLDKFAQYAEWVTDRHCERLNKGRNFGFWNTGVYILGKLDSDVQTVMGMLRAVYSGEESYIEPIRAHILNSNSGALDIIGRCDLIPLVSDKLPEEQLNDNWNALGEIYQYISTPLNTEELSIATSLPRRDVPGLRFVRTSVRFANNPAPVTGDTICLGKVVDTGVMQSNEYRIDPNALVRHAIVSGSTGSGKSTTCKTIINEVMDRGVPVMIIEPAKDDYVRYAIGHNKRLDEDASLTDSEREQKKFTIYMPGLDGLDGARFSRLKINPFQPAAIDGAPIDMLTRCEQAISLFNASLPASDVLPILIDESLYKYVYEQIGEDFLAGDIPPRSDFPKLSGVTDTARRVLNARGYDKKVQDDIAAALETRFNYLTRGKRGNILNVNNSTNYESLFSRPAVINLSKIASPKDKALVMSFLVLALYEYRVSAYSYDEKYRGEAQKNKLLHLTLIEEAHNVLSKPSADVSGSGNPQQVVADLFGNMLSEIRSYGQGIVIVDQVPTRLIPDAIKNTNYKIVHRLTAPDDCAVMAAGLALRDDQQNVIPTLGVGDAIICGDLDDAAAWVRLNLPKGV